MRSLCVTLLMLVLLTGCSLRQTAMRAVLPVFDDLVSALFAEPNLDLARPALASDIKLIEGLRVSNDSPRLAELNAMALTGYALFFCENESMQEAAALYQRATRAACELLEVDPYELSQEEFSSWLKEQDSLPGLFWAAFPQGLYIRSQLNEPAALFRLPRVEQMLARTQELDPAYFMAGAALFQGVLDCARPRMLGGDPERGQLRLQQADALCPEELLLAELFEAWYYCPATLDEERFDELLCILQETDPGPGSYALVNAWCRQQAYVLAEKRTLWF